MALGTFIAGRYSATYNSVDLGIMSDGYEIQVDPKEQVINRSDAFGDMMIESIFRGADWFCQYEAMEYKAGPISAYFPFAAPGAVGVIGRLGSAIAQSVVLTATAGTPAAAAPATLTAALAKLAPNSSPRWKMDSMLRLLPTRLQFYPSDVGAGVIKHFTTT